MKFFRHYWSLAVFVTLSASAQAAEVDCTPPKVLSPELMSLATQAAPQCFDNRLREFDRHGKSQVEIYNSEASVCSCLNTNKFTSMIMVNGTTPDTKDLEASSRELLQNQIQHINDHMEIQRNASLFQALSLNGSEEDNAFLELYSQGDLKTSTIKMLNHANQQIRETRTEFKDLPEIKVPDELNSKYLKDDASECFQIRDFLAYKQIPDSNEVYQILAQTPVKAFRPEDWSLLELESTKSEDPAVKAKISFLQSNPLYQDLLSISNPSAKIKEQQVKLFTLLKNSFGEVAKACPAGALPGLCKKAYLESNKNEENLNHIKAIFEEPEVINATNEAAKFELSRVFGREYGYLLRKYRPEMSTMLSNSSVNDCDETLDEATSQEYGTCVQKYAGHCKIIAGLKDMYPFKVEDEDDLAAVSRNLTDEDKNQEFSQLKENLCQAIHTNGKLPKVSMNFQTFRSELCKGADAPAECSPKERNKLLAKFLKSYPALDFGGKPQELASATEMNSLLSFLEQSRSKEMTDGALKSIAEAPKTSEEFAKKLQNYTRTYIPKDFSQAVASSADLKPSTAPTSVIAPGSRASSASIQPEAPVSQALASAPALPLPTLLPPVPQASAPKAATTSLPNEIPHSTSEATTTSPAPVAAAAAANPNFSKLEKQIADLTKALGENTKAKEKDSAEPVARTPAAVAPAATTAAAPATFQAATAGGQAFVANSGPAASAVRDSYFPMSFPQSGSGSTSASLSNGQALYNVKYNLDKTSTDGKIILAKEIQSSNLDAMIISEAKKNGTVPVTVTKEEYDKIASKDEGVLNALASRIGNVVGDVLQLKVISSSAGLVPIDIIFMKKDGKMLFQPIRTYRIDALRALTKPI
jgi:hypothetical protein